MSDTVTITISRECAESVVRGSGSVDGYSGVDQRADLVVACRQALQQEQVMLEGRRAIVRRLGALQFPPTPEDNPVVHIEVFGVDADNCRFARPVRITITPLEGEQDD